MFAAERFRQPAEPPRLEPMPGRVPPSDLDAEAAVLSATLLDSDAFDAVQEILQPLHFYADANRRIYEAILELQSASKPVDIVSVAGYLRDKGRLEQIGGTPYLAQLADEGYGDTGEVQGFIDQAEQSVFDIARIAQSSNVVSVRDAIKGAFEVLGEAARRGGGITGIATGYPELDKQVAGLHAGDLYIVAARPGMGKTSFVLNLATNIARPQRVEVNPDNDAYFDAAVEEPGYGVLFCSLEMPREQLASRMLASEARVDMSRIRSGKLQRDDWNKLTDAASRLGRLPIWLDDTPALTLLDLRAKIRRLQAELKRGEAGKTSKGLGLVAVDYLQLMQGRRDAGSREQEISELSRGLKQLAKEMKIAVLALSQLNRAVETRTSKDKRPQLSDLRESGAIEQDADTIMFIYRDEYYFKDSPDKGIAELIIAKQRNGPTGKVMTKFTSECTRFDNLAPEEYNFHDFDDFAGGGAAEA